MPLVQGVLQSVADTQTELLAEMAQSGRVNGTRRVQGEDNLLFATELDALRDAGYQSTDANGRDVSRLSLQGFELHLPATFFGNITAGAVLSAMALSPQTAARLGGDPPQVLAAAVIDVNELQSGRAIKVEGLQEPITFSLPVNFSAGVKCAYWDPDLAEWSTRGVTVSNLTHTGGPLWCNSVHLSLFGAIIEGMIATFLCSNFDLFTYESVKQVFRGTWYKEMGSLVTLMVLGITIFSLAAAAVVDHRRRKLGWRDEFFLVSEGDHRQSNKDEEEGSGEAKKKEALAVASLLCSCCSSLYSNSAFQEALDDILSNWCEFLGDIRSCLTTMAEGCELLGGGFSFQSMSHQSVSHMMILTSRRAAAASLGMSQDLVNCVLDDEELADFIIVQRERATSRNSPTGVQVQPNRSFSAGEWGQQQTQAEALSHLREEICKAVHTRVSVQHSRLHVCGSMCWIFAMQNPLGDAFAIDIFQSCKQKVACLAAELWGSFAFCALFFQTSGGVRGRPRGAEVDCSNGSVGASMGRFAAIALGSLVAAGLPVMILGSLQTKCFKKVDGHPGSQAWRRQLRAWRYQERLFGLFSLSYIAACACYVLIFLANLGEEDHIEFSTAGALALFQDFVLIPMFTAILLPLSMSMLFHAHSRWHKVSQDELVRRVCEDLMKKTNTMLPREAV